MSKNMNNLMLLGVLLFGTLSAPELFGSQKRELSMRDQLFGTAEKRRKLDQGEELVQGPLFTVFEDLPMELKDITVQMAAVSDLKSLLFTNKTLYGLVMARCEKSLSDANLHMQYLESIFKIQKKNMKKQGESAVPCSIRKAMSHALYTYRIARESDAQGHIDSVIQFSEKVLKIKFPNNASDDKMLIDN